MTPGLKLVGKSDIQLSQSHAAESPPRAGPAAIDKRLLNDEAQVDVLVDPQGYRAKEIPASAIVLLKEHHAGS